MPDFAMSPTDRSASGALETMPRPGGRSRWKTGWARLLARRARVAWLDAAELDITGSAFAVGYPTLLQAWPSQTHVS
jgi:hypothetical protein